MVVGSREVAENFGKEHSKVIRSIESIIEGLAKSGDTPKSIFFIESEYTSEQNNQVYREYLLTRDGFSLIVMGFTGKKALEWKLKYINAFNSMETTLKQVLEKPTALTITEDTKLLDSIKNTLDEVKQVTMVLTHKQKIDLTKNIIYPQLEIYGIESKYKKKVTKIIKENLVTNGKWENIRINDGFSKTQFKEDVRNNIEIIKKNNPLYFKNAEYSVKSMFD